MPILQNILTNQDVCNTVGAQFYEDLPVKHDVLNFVDDSNSVSTAEPGVNIEDYANNYFKLSRNILQQSKTKNEHWQNTTPCL